MGLTALACPGFGTAGDWSLSAEVSQRLEADTNARNAASPDAAIGVTTTGSATAQYRTKTLDWSTAVGGTAAVFIGEDPGAGLDRVNPTISSDIAIRRKSYSLSGGVRARARPTSVSQFEDTGITEVDATQFDLNATTGVAFDLNRSTSLGFGTSVALVRFSDDAASFRETDTFGLTSSLSRAVNRRTTLRATTGLRYFTADSAAQTRSQILTIGGGFDHRVNSRLSFGLDLGADIDRSRATRDGVRDTEASIGFNGGASLDWTPDQRSNFNLALRQSLDPTAFGDLRRTTALSGGASYQATKQVDLGVTVAATDRSAGGVVGSTSLQTLRLSPNLSYQITRDWSATLGYEFRLSRRPEDTRSSNEVFLQFGRSFSILP